MSKGESYFTAGELRSWLQIDGKGTSSQGAKSNKCEEAARGIVKCLKAFFPPLVFNDVSGIGLRRKSRERRRRHAKSGTGWWDFSDPSGDDVRSRGNVVLLYASMHNDVPVIINLSGRFALERGIDGRLGKEFMQRIKIDGFIDVKDRTGKVEYRVTEESLMDRLTTDMRAACHAIDKECRVLTIHGSADEIVPSEDAFEFDKLIPNHKLLIIEGADHCYTAHQDQLASLVLDFIKSAQVVEATAARAI